LQSVTYHCCPIQILMQATQVILNFMGVRL
jgi:hypothetical protein